ncbi:3-keto-steroid reductase/17-beta-hydroxysteroid dehydrogenase 7-like isoform X3 [Dreissena polymorpha]|uniref:3-keto-steroid reductase/17-beta-hydroxysteroid dehydrogenase 7-like isoform X3 n=1 Tax=Dreissena polymorpha TaxID=45954 RepID=UPI0022654D27|nr:3-keto-steroid reductase/17-beta-hydroxysteroid dehydrogenase 7-like isoform X3 [Dreissena polymorpha]
MHTDHLSKLKEGVGLSLADRLLTEYRNLHICLACRNEGRAENAQHKLLRRHPGASVSVIIVDVSSVKSVLEAAERIKEKFQKIDFLYLNAGIMKVSSINWSKVLQIFSKDGAKILSTGWGVLNHIDGVTDEGLQEVFATNLFGHFVLVRELQDYLTASGNVKIVWTSSQNANAGDLNYEDVQHRKGREPYSSSKQASDVLSVALNERLNKQGVYSTVTCPGLVFSNLLFGILPSLLWILLLPFLFFMRLFVSNLTCSPYKGAESLVWTSKQRSESLDSRVKYLSNCSVLGKPFIGQEKVTALCWASPSSGKKSCVLTARRRIACTTYWRTCIRDSRGDTEIYTLPSLWAL